MNTISAEATRVPEKSVIGTQYYAYAAAHRLCPRPAVWMYWRWESLLRQSITERLGYGKKRWWECAIKRQMPDPLPSNWCNRHGFDLKCHHPLTCLNNLTRTNSIPWNISLQPLLSSIPPIPGSGKDWQSVPFYPLLVSSRLRSLSGSMAKPSSASFHFWAPLAIQKVAHHSLQPTSY